jgi:hypothetical protein
MTASPDATVPKRPRVARPYKKVSVTLPADLLDEIREKVDAVVVATALTLPSPVLVVTSDPTDLAVLTDGLVGVEVGTI